MKPDTFVDMITPRNSLSIVMITSSIVLLMALQFFWLRKVYRDEEHGFRKETGFIFRNTMFALNDSVLQKNIRPMKSDSNSIRIIRTTQTTDSVMFGRRHSDLPFTFQDSTANIQVYISPDSHDGDSLVHALRPLVSRIRENRQQRFFSIRLKSDTIPITIVNGVYRSSLLKAGFNTAFFLTRLEPPPDGHIKKEFDDPDKVILTPSGAFQIQFPGLQWIIFRKIIPQILFALFLTLITISAFIILYKSLRSQQRLMEIKNDFINNMTHELKTPVATVSVAIEALQNFNVLDNPKLASEYLSIAQSELKRLTLMTDKILKTSVFEKNGIDMHRENVDVNQMVLEVIDSMELVASKQKATISFKKEGENFTVNGSAEHLENVFYNLLDNAIKYSHEKSIIEITIKELAHYVTYSIHDNGIGIPKSYQKKIFDKFFRVPHGDIHTTKGYGLGLSYVASVVKSHGGTVQVESEEGRGSCFVVSLPKRANA
ncbi:MAG TPA: HAMP domain-containing sensor histidine kinase [Chryseolinea sp.]|nr:HAMP domain-containing sensor histidine kinase [Chryseolinea sp.]HPH46639.1 HAMP domain-containing sensor histidine kinase [Chryseolinea sp.]HPM31889.1 HAMP domain-containing sensor histidine kinase [Chryseolinea sp.]